MKIRYLLFVIAIPLSFCSDPHPYQAHIDARLTVSDSLDDSGDYSEIELIIIQENPDYSIDTLFAQTTDQEGKLSGTIYFPNFGPYPMIINRFGNRIAVNSVILSDQDSVKIQAELPRVGETISTQSREETAMQALTRVEKGFQRLQQFVQRGALPQDTLPTLIRQWSDLYWSVYETYPKSYAGFLAATQSTNMMMTVDDSLTQRQLQTIDDEVQLVRIAASLGIQHYGRQGDLDKGISYADSLLQTTEDLLDRSNITQMIISVLYDSLRIEQARTRLNRARSEFGDFSAMREWAKEREPDLNRLAPGEKVPNAILSFDGQQTDLHSLLGQPMVIEFAGMANRGYQNQYSQMRNLYYVYEPFGLKVITIPLDTVQVRIDAFYEERGSAWPVTDAGVFQADSLQEKFNITRIPTRLLIDAEGRIVQKLIGDKMNILSDLILNLFKQEETL